MVHRPRPPRKNLLSFLIPFLLIILIFVWAFYSFQSLILKKTYFKDTFATVIPWSKWVEIMLSWNETWTNITKKVKLFKNDALKTTSSSAKVEFPWNNIVNLDKNTSLLIESLLADNSFSDIKISLWEWRIWVEIWRMINPKSQFLILAENMEITSKWWIYSVEWNWIRVIEWSADVNIKNWSKLIWQLTVWVWQELILTDKIISAAKLWNLPELRAISDEFKLSSWYNTNYRNKWDVTEDVVNNMIKVETETWSTTSIWESLTDDSKKEEEEESNNVKKEEHIWEISFDIEEWKEFEIEKNEMITISWKVPTNVSSVVINDWKLTQFKPWDINFKYNAATKWNNLKEWENKFEVEAFDSEWLIIKKWELKIDVKIKSNKEEEVEEKPEDTNKTEEPKEEEVETNDKEEAETKEEERVETKETEENEKVEEDNSSSANEDTEETESNTQSAWLTLQVTSHEDWENVKVLEWQALEIKWIAPENAAKITVWDYELKSFKKWDWEFLFRVAEEWWNMTRWWTNKYSIEAYDEDWNSIEEIKFTIFIEE